MRKPLVINYFNTNIVLDISCWRLELPLSLAGQWSAASTSPLALLAIGECHPRHSASRFWKWPNFKTTSNILQNKFKPSSKALQKHFKYRVLWVQRYKIFLNYANFSRKKMKSFWSKIDKKNHQQACWWWSGERWPKWSKRTTNWSFVKAVKLQRNLKLCKILCIRKWL